MALACLLFLVAGSAARIAACDKNCVGRAQLALDGTVFRRPLTELRYLENQPANFTCSSKPSGPNSNVSVQLSYFSMETKTVSTTFKEQDSVEMYMRLSRAHNDTLVTCSARHSERDHVVQVRLLQRPDDYEQGKKRRAVQNARHPLQQRWLISGFVVSGLRLVAAEGARADGESELRYQYRYMRDELMSVQLIWNARRYAAVRCRVAGERFPGAWQDHVAAADAHVGLSLTNASLLPEQSNTELHCIARRVDPTDPFAPDLHLMLTFIFYELVPEVGGLAMWGVELLYIADNITTVYYNNAAAANGTHYLTCSPDPVSWWVWNPGEVDRNPDHNIGDNDFPRAFRLYEHAEWTLLQCVREKNDVRPKRTTHVWLHRHRPIAVPKEPAAVPEKPAAVPEKPADMLSSREGAGWWWVVVAVAVVAVVALVATVVVKVRQRTRKQSTVRQCSNDHVYEEVFESATSSGTSMPFPAGATRSRAAEKQGARHFGDDGGLFYETPYAWTYLRRPVSATRPLK